MSRYKYDVLFRRFSRRRSHYYPHSNYTHSHIHTAFNHPFYLLLVRAITFIVIHLFYYRHFFSLDIQTLALTMSDSFNPYAQLYAKPAGPGDQRPTALQVIEDNGAKGTWAGRVALVTGGTSGIGLATVGALHSTGADVYFTARNLEKAAATKADILKASQGSGKLEVIEMDMDSLNSVRKAAKYFLNKSDRLNVLINNAGKLVMPLTPGAHASRLTNKPQTQKASWHAQKPGQRTASSASLR
jgi:hypothetical protein